jgi:hypothetical protein
MRLNFLPVDTESSISGDDDMMNYFLIDLKSTKYRLMYLEKLKITIVLINLNSCDET